MKFNNITKYIEKFNKSSEHGRWQIDNEGDGTPTNPIQMPFVIYSEVVFHFVKDMYNGFMDTKYTETLKKYSISDFKKVTYEDLECQNSECVLAILTGIIRGDRFCEGLLLSCLDNGLVVLCLERLRVIDVEYTRE